MTDKRPSSTAWIMVHIAFPLCPFFIEGAIRFIVFDDSLSLNTFSSSTLAVSVGLLCLFVSQCLFSYKTILPNDEELESVIGAAHIFSIFAIVCFVVFGILVLLSALSQKGISIDVSNIKNTFDTLILIGGIIPIISSFYAQKSFKLRATI